MRRREIIFQPVPKGTTKETPKPRPKPEPAPVITDYASI